MLMHEIAPDLRRAVDDFGARVDPFSRVKTMRRFTGADDVIADLQVAYDVLDGDAPELALARVLSLTRKIVVLRMALTEARTEDYWRAMLRDKVYTIKWDTDGKKVAVTGVPRVGIDGISAKGVLTPDERWDHVQAAVARVAKRIDVVDAHDRTAIIACYGPSLATTVQRLQDERRETGGAVVSVSGAHDFLLGRGITPDFHVECDPRPHKADNIAKAHPGVVYLIGSCCHGVLFDKLDGADVRLWHVAGDHTKRLYTETSEDGRHIITGGGSVGLRSVPLLYAMGYRDFSIYGMDCSFADEGETQWAGKHAGKRQDVVQAACGGRVFATSPVLLTYATGFVEMWQSVDDMRVRLYGDGLLQAMMREQAMKGTAQ